MALLPLCTAQTMSNCTVHDSLACFGPSVWGARTMLPSPDAPTHLPPWGSDTVLPDLALCQVERLSAMVEMSPERTEAVEERVRLQVRSLEWHCCKAARQGLMHLIWSTRGCIGGCMPSRHGLLHLQLAGLPSLMMFSPCMQAAASACKTPPLACNGLGAAGQMTFSGGWHQSVTQGCFGTGC